MKATSVFIVQSNSILTLAMTSLFAKDAAIHVIPSSSADTAGLIDEISRQDPDVVVMEENAFCAENDFLGQVLAANPKLRVIVIHRNSNRLEVFRKDDILLTSASDLIDVVYSA